jgi:hypothetical protein
MLQAVLLSLPEYADLCSVVNFDLVRPSILLGAFFSNVIVSLCCSRILRYSYAYIFYLSSTESVKYY